MLYYAIFKGYVIYEPDRYSVSYSFIPHTLYKYGEKGLI